MASRPALTNSPAVFTRLFLALLHASMHAQPSNESIRGRYTVGTVVQEPFDLRGRNGELEIDLTIRNDIAADGSAHYCYVTADGNQTPTLRLNPGDLLNLNLKHQFEKARQPDGQGRPLSSG